MAAPYVDCLGHGAFLTVSARSRSLYLAPMSAYRSAAKRDAEAVEEGPLARVDASGRRGEDGAAGRSGSHGSHGGDGESGGHAGRASPGEHGGRIDLHLASVAGTTQVRLQGSLSARGGSARIEETCDFFHPTAIELAAPGGRGGRGGDGGDGGDGGHGARGSDATRYSDGTNGGRGGDGGDAGAGSDGARGGNGGTIVVRVDEADMHLFMLVHANVAGGSGGRAGSHGRAGSGGSGGEGGSSYHWSETETYTDGNGQLQTRTTSHSRSGGSHGASGSPGREIARALHDGPHGTSGALAYEIARPGGTVERFPGRYDVRLVSFVHRSENDDGVYEPSERGFVGTIEVENPGPMPLPVHTPVTVELVPSEWIAPPEDARGNVARLELPRGLGPGQRHTFTEELPFVVAGHAARSAGAPLAAPETLRLRATVPAVRRSFDAFDRGASEALGSIVVRHPIALDPVVALPSLAPGEATKVHVTVRNVATRSYGARGDVARSVRVGLALGHGDLGPNDVRLVDDRDGPRDLADPQHHEVERVDGGATALFSLVLGVAPTAAPYTAARLTLTCELEGPEGAAKTRAVHVVEHTVRVGRRFVREDADVLLVVHEETTADELGAWEAHAKALGLRLATWDVSLESGADVLDAAVRGDVRFGLVVVPNPKGKREAPPLAAIPKTTVLALARRGTRVVVLGKTKDLAKYLGPTATTNDDPPLPHGTRKDALVDAILGLAPNEGPVRAEVVTTYVWPWSEIDRRDLDRRAERLSAELARRAPDRRYLVVPRYEAGAVERTLFVRRAPSGTLEVRRALDPGDGALRMVPLEDADVHDAGRLASAALFALFFVALPFELKLRVVAAGDTAAEDAARCPWVLALVGDLLVEAAPFVGAPGLRARLRADDALPKLGAFERALEELTVDAARARAAAVVAWLEVVARDRVRFWEYLPPFFFTRASQALRRRAAVTSQRFDTKLGAPARLEAIAAVRAVVSASREGDPAATAESAARGAASAIAPPTKVDADALPPSERVLTSDELDDLTRGDTERDGHARDTREASTTQRDALLAAIHYDDLSPRARVAAESDDAETATAADLGDLLEARHT